MTLQSALSGQADIALGNVVGSNISNVLLVLGLSALIAPLIVSRRLVRLEVLITVGVSFSVLILALDGSIGRLDGALYFAGALAYSAFAILRNRKESEDNGEAKTALGQILLIVVGLSLLVVGSRWLQASQKLPVPYLFVLALLIVKV